MPSGVVAQTAGLTFSAHFQGITVLASLDICEYLNHDGFKWCDLRMLEAEAGGSLEFKEDLDYRENLIQNKMKQQKLNPSK